MSDAQPDWSALEVVACRLVNYAAERGYGFMANDEGGPDLMFHKHAFMNAGFEEVPEAGTRVCCLLQLTERGPYTPYILGRDEEVFGPEFAYVKRVDQVNGRVYLQLADIEDMIIYRTVLTVAGILNPQPRQWLSVWYIIEPLGSRAVWATSVIYVE